jgi:hypothetical protein
VSRLDLDPENPPPSLEEQYELASGTSDLGLPRGEGAGAQGILAAAAWNEVRMGTALMRLRAQWESARPHKRVPRPVAVLRAAGLSKEQAKRLHNRERVAFGLSYYEAKRALRQRIPEYQQAIDNLVFFCLRGGKEESEALAASLLDRWLDDPSAAPQPGTPERELWAHIEDCLSRARAGLRSGMRGSTENERTRQELDAIGSELGLTQPPKG